MTLFEKNIAADKILQAASETVKPGLFRMSEHGPVPLKQDESEGVHCRYISNKAFASIFRDEQSG